MAAPAAAQSSASATAPYLLDCQEKTESRGQGGNNPARWVTSVDHQIYRVDPTAKTVTVYFNNKSELHKTFPAIFPFTGEVVFCEIEAANVPCDNEYTKPLSNGGAGTITRYRTILRPAALTSTASEKVSTVNGDQSDAFLFLSMTNGVCTRRPE